MSKVWKFTIISFLSAIIGGVAMLICKDHPPLVLLFADIYASILFICFLSTGIATKIKKNISPYCIFAIADFVTGIVLTVLFTSYLSNISDPADVYISMIIYLCLYVCIIPFIIITLIMDLIVWRKSKSKQ